MEEYSNTQTLIRNDVCLFVTGVGVGTESKIYDAVNWCGGTEAVLDLLTSLRPSGGEDWELLQESDGCSLNQQTRCLSLER